MDSVMPLAPISVCSLARLRESIEPLAPGLPTWSLNTSTEGAAWCCLSLCSRLKGPLLPKALCVLSELETDLEKLAVVSWSLCC